ncbi:MAG TPA: hypothetical protein VGR38_06055 [Candidatus Polarisedimenticolia bacterium]|nr:hypothetical protein [Candidatus Polarisedimenticolia bacterium]
MVLALVQRSFDAPGLVVFNTALVLLIFFTLYRSARLLSPGPTVLAGLLLLGALASEPRFEVRPEIVSYLLLVLTLHLLHRRALGLPSPLWPLPLVFALWANCHSFFLLGWTALACFAIGGWIRRGRPDRPLLGWSLAAVGATFINPYGISGVLFPFSVMGRMQSGNIFKQTIGELASPLNPAIPQQFPFFPMFPVHCFQLFALGALISLPFLPRRRRYDLCLLAGAFLIPATAMLRNMPWLVLTALPGMAHSFSPRQTAGKPLEAERWKRRLRLAALIAVSGMALGLTMRVVHGAYYIGSRRSTRSGFGWNEMNLPLAAARYAETSSLGGPVLNHLNFGGVLMWKLRQPVFIHARLEVVGESFYREYMQALESEAALEATVRRFGIEWIIFPYVTNGDLLTRLGRDSRWRLAYVDSTAVIFLRNRPGAEARVDPTLASRITAEPRPLPIGSLPGLGGPPRKGAGARWVEGFFRREKYPWDDYALGLFHFFYGQPRRAEAHFGRAVQQSGGAYYELYLNLAASLYWQHRYAEARACDRIVLADDPGNALARGRLERTRADPSSPQRDPGGAPPGPEPGSP